MSTKPRQPIPEETWKPIAEATAAEYGITLVQLLYGSRALRFSIPRARFWRKLRQHPPKGYSLYQIADITGVDFSSVRDGMKAKHVDREYATVPKYPRYTNKPWPKMIGRRFGSLTVLEKVERPTGMRTKHVRWWRCRCNCGAERIVNSRGLSLDVTKSCGGDAHRQQQSHLARAA